MTVRLADALATLLLSLSLHLPLKGQKIEFDVASVKLSTTEGHRNKSDPGRVDIHGEFLRGLLRAAYGVAAYQVVGPKGWDIGPLDIVAEMPPGTTSEQYKLMLQNLLHDRLGLRFHEETRNLAVYQLLVSGGGIKMAPAPETPPGEDAPHILPFRVTIHQFTRNIRGQLTIPSLIVQVGYALEYPIVDGTGLPGKYEINLTFYGPPPLGTALSAGRTIGSGAGATPSWWLDNTDLAASLEKQLGLRLVPKHMPFKVIVIDHVDKTPVEN